MQTTLNMGAHSTDTLMYHKILLMGGGGGGWCNNISTVSFTGLILRIDFIRLLGLSSIHLITYTALFYGYVRRRESTLCCT